MSKQSIHVQPQSSFQLSNAGLGGIILVLSDYLCIVFDTLNEKLKEMV